MAWCLEPGASMLDRRSLDGTSGLILLHISSFECVFLFCFEFSVGIQLEEHFRRPQLTDHEIRNIVSGSGAHPPRRSDSQATHLRLRNRFEIRLDSPG